MKIIDEDIEAKTGSIEKHFFNATKIADLIFSIKLPIYFKLNYIDMKMVYKTKSISVSSSKIIAFDVFDLSLDYSPPNHDLFESLNFTIEQDFTIELTKKEFLTRVAQAFKALSFQIMLKINKEKKEDER